MRLHHRTVHSHGLKLTERAQTTFDKDSLKKVFAAASSTQIAKSVAASYAAEAADLVAFYRLFRPLVPSAMDFDLHFAESQALLRQMQVEEWRILFLESVLLA